MSLRQSKVRTWIQTYLQKQPSPKTGREILDSINQDLKTVHKTSVYRALEIMESLGQIRSILAFDNRLYEARTEPHCHLACTNCSSVTCVSVTIPISEITDSATSIQFRIQTINVEIKGLCHNCAEQFSTQ